MGVTRTFLEDDDYTYRKLRVSLSGADWQIFADALAEEFPDARYYYEPMVLFRLFTVPPPIFPGDHLLRLEGLGQACPPEVDMHFDQNWQIKWKRPEPGIDIPAGSADVAWSSNSPRSPTFRFVFGQTRPAQDGHPPHITDGYLWMFYAPGNKQQFAICHRVMRLFRSVADRTAQVLLAGPRQKEIRRYPGVSPYWLGKDAVRWARENPERMLYYCQYSTPETSWGIRPAVASVG